MIGSHWSRLAILYSSTFAISESQKEGEKDVQQNSPT